MVVETIKRTEKLLVVVILILLIAVVIVFSIMIIKNIKEEEEKEEYVYQLQENKEILSVTLGGEKQTVEEQPIEEPSLTPLDPTYKGYPVAGKISIPKTGLDIPFLDGVTVDGMKIAPCMLYNTGEVNISGNIYIVGHNYRNGTLFSKNDKIVEGDKIYITAMNGATKEYTVYSKFITTDEDVSFLKRQIEDNTSEITLQTCTNDNKNRIIILAK